MIRISFDEYVGLIKTSPYVGYYSCFCTSASKYGAPSVMYVAPKIYLLFQAHEVEGNEWQEWMQFIKEQND